MKRKLFFKIIAFVVVMFISVLAISLFNKEKKNFDDEYQNMFI
jgi:hypothetical protein